MSDKCRVSTCREDTEEDEDWCEDHVSEMKPDWSSSCASCSSSPVMPLTGMCGPCTTGDASTAQGEW